MKYIRIACVILIVFLVGAFVSTLLEASEVVDDYNSNSNTSSGENENTGTEDSGTTNGDNTETETPDDTDSGNTEGGSDSDSDDTDTEEEQPAYEITETLSWQCECQDNGYPISYTFPDDLEHENISFDSEIWEEGNYRYYAYINIHCENCGASCSHMFLYDYEKIS